MSSQTKTALLVIDVQAGLIAEGAYQEKQFLQNVATLLEKARSSGTEVIYVQHHEEYQEGLFWGSANWQICSEVAPKEGELIIHKDAPDAFFRTNLQAELQARGIEHLVIAGMQTQTCIDTTARSAPAHGYNATLAADAHTTGDGPHLTAAQQIDFVNDALHGFWAAEHVVRVKPVAEIQFA